MPDILNQKTKNRSRKKPSGIGSYVKSDYLCLSEEYSLFMAK
jgi:hypothetical protein